MNRTPTFSPSFTPSIIPGTQEQPYRLHMMSRKPELKSLPSLVNIARFCAFAGLSIMSKRPVATVVYSTETGTSKRSRGGKI